MIFLFIDPYLSFLVLYHSLFFLKFIVFFFNFVLARTQTSLSQFSNTKLDNNFYIANYKKKILTILSKLTPFRYMEKHSRGLRRIRNETDQLSGFTNEKRATFRFQYESFFTEF